MPDKKDRNAERLAREQFAAMYRDYVNAIEAASSRVLGRAKEVRDAVTERRQKAIKAGTWNEADHPRADDGRFGDVAGSTGSNGNDRRREEKPGKESSQQANSPAGKGEQARPEQPAKPDNFAAADHPAVSQPEKVGGDGAENKGEAKASFMTELTANAKKLGGKVADKIGRPVWDKLPSKVQGALVIVWGKARQIEHVAMAGFSKGKEMALEVARQRGLPQGHVDKVGKFLAVTDTIMAWTVNFPIVTAATGSVGAGKTASFLPVASLAYIAMSGVRNPFALARAARAVVKRRGQGAEHKSMKASPDSIASLIESLENANASEWYQALIYAALDETGGDMEEAIKLANEALLEQAEAPADTDDDLELGDLEKLD